MLKILLILQLLLIVPFKVSAEESFELWIENYKKSVSQNISEATIKRAFDNTKIDEKVLKLSQKQPEHVLTFWNYFEKMINDRRIRIGQKFVERRNKELNKLEQQYNVDKHIVTALYAMETDFGRVTGHFDILSSLITLSYSSNRKDFFKSQLTALLKSIDRGVLDFNLKGSWAGAFGFFQFMPVTYVIYSADGNNDGKINLFTFDDAFASSFRYLSMIGYNKSEPCLIEVSIPNDFDWKVFKNNETHSVKEWLEIGILPVNSDDFSNTSLKAELIMPEGYLGPTFLGFNNFKILQSWNKSNYYVISACQLADAFAYKPIIERKRFLTRAISRPKAMRIQEKLMDLGLYNEGVDGVIGEKTRKALRQVQLEMGLPADGYPTDELFEIWKLNDEEIN
ncbi:MAG: Membrane-bound lytic murein transglycosylase B precursor [Alphaproteobacteria bacterium ADurb.Bin438]|nr:MAG: Membrane-bound lytic murein transglycosylase B precursor [Alphaproteobacteria bacterium ADurb.Bin438]